MLKKEKLKRFFIKNLRNKYKFFIKSQFLLTLKSGGFLGYISVKRYRCIRQDIKDSITAQRCAILDTSSNIEIDHKNGRYDELSNMDTTTQKESEFQPLNKVCNDAKREHCKRCRETKKRYDARRLGYSHGWTVGDEDTDSCIGCYWYDIKAFNKKISSKY